MFKAIKEFFVGKPKVEEAPAQCPYKAEPVPAPAETVTVDTSPVESAPDVVIISTSNTMDVSIDKQPDTITLTSSTATDPGVWPFPNTPPAESTTKKKRTFVKREEPATEKKPTPAIKVNKNKSRKKK